MTQAVIRPGLRTGVRTAPAHRGDLLDDVSPDPSAGADGFEHRGEGAAPTVTAAQNVASRSLIDESPRKRSAGRAQIKDSAHAREPSPARDGADMLPMSLRAARWEGPRPEIGPAASDRAADPDREESGRMIGTTPRDRWDDCTPIITGSRTSSGGEHPGSRSSPRSALGDALRREIVPPSRPFERDNHGQASDSSRTAGEAPPIHVTIGRIEVRAILPAAPASRGDVRSPSGPALTLEQYEQQRNRRIR